MYTSKKSLNKLPIPDVVHTHTNYYKEEFTMTLVACLCGFYLIRFSCLVMIIGNEDGQLLLMTFQKI